MPEGPVLIPTDQSPYEYTLKEGEDSVWITVGILSVHVIRTDEGVVVDIYPLDKEDEEAIASTYAFTSEALDDMEWNYKDCDICGNETSFERTLPGEPAEGDKCSICGKWVCKNCIDWGYMASEQTEDVICRKCSH